MKARNDRKGRRIIDNVTQARGVTRKKGPFFFLSKRRSRFLSVTGLLAAASLFVLTTIASGVGGQIELSSKEKAWLNAHPVIRHAPDPDYAPFEFRDKTNHYTGIAPDFLKLVEEKLGVRIETVPSASWAASLENVKHQRADLVTVATKTPERSEYMLFTSPYIEFSNVILVREDVSGSFTLADLAGKTLAGIKGWAITTHIQKQYPAIKFHWVKSVKAGLEAVSGGTADAVLFNRATAGYWRAKTDITNLRIAGETTYTYKLSFASRKDWPQLSTLLEKALKSISKSERKEIIDKWIFPFERGWSPGPEFWIALGGIILLLLIAGFFVWNLQLRRQVRARTIDLQTELNERKRAEEALQTSQVRYKELFDAMPSGVAVYEAVDDGNDFVFKAFNRGGERIDDIKREDVMGKRLTEAFPGIKDFGLFDVLQKVSKTGNPEHYPIGFYKDQRISGWRDNFVYKLSSGEIVAIYSDETERKLAEEALRESEEKFRAIFEQAAVGVGQIETETGRILMVNQRYCEIVGYTQQEMNETTLMEITHPDDVQQSLDNIQRLIRGEIRDSTFEKRYVRKDGSIVWVNLTISPMWGVGEKPNYHIGVVEDITGRKQVEEALRESKNNLDKAQKIAHIGNWSRDLKTDQGQWSDEAYRIFGLAPGSPEHPTHEDFLSCVHPDDREHVESMIKKAVEERGSFEYEFRTVLINGSERIIHSRGEVECDEAGVPVRRFGINHDITETRRLQAQVQEAQKTEAIVALAGGIAHNFNNALTPIIGNIDLLEMAHDQDEKTMECLKDMKTSGLRMAHLTNQILAYAEGGKYNPHVLSLSDFVDATLPLIQHTLDPAVRVETDLPLDVKDVEADSTQMQMVLSAILGNSNEAMEGSGRIRISTRNMDLDQEFIKDYPGLKPGPHVCLSIEDDGKGMDEETRNRIFDPFFTTHFMGRGLGMAAVYGIIKNHDGAITVDSELGKGTVVRIYLPAIEAEEKPKKVVVSKPEIELPMGDATILVIEDEEDVMMLFRQVLEMLGYRVLQAETGKKAIRLAKTFDGQIDLALLDIKLPDMTGDKVYPLIMEARPDLKVIVCSGYTIEGPPQDILDAGAEGFVQKPFHIATLAEKLKEVLEGK